MQKNNKSIFVFFISMLITLVVLGIILSIFLIITEQIAVKDTSKSNEVLYQVKPKASDSIDLLFVCCEKIESEPSFVSHINYNAETGAIKGEIYDTGLSLSKNGIKKSLSSHYLYAGVSEVIDALKESYNSPPSSPYYILVSEENLSYIVDFLGGVNYNLTEHQANYLDCEAGEQLLDGRRFTKLFFAVDYDIKYDIDTQRKLISMLLQNSFNQKQTLTADSFNNVIIGNSETNISLLELSKRADGFNYNIKHHTFSVEFN